MRMSWFTGWRPGRRRGGGRKRQAKSVPLRVRQLERRRVLDAAVQSLAISAVTSEIAPPPPTSNNVATPPAESSNAPSSNLLNGPGLNSPPLLITLGDKTVDEGHTLNLSGSGGPAAALFIDPDDAPADHTATIDWGDGSAVESGTIIPGPGGSGAIGGSHVYADDGTYTVTVTVSDFFGGSDSGTFNVTVNNVAPEITGDLSNLHVNEGQAFILSNTGGPTFNLGLGISDPGFDNPLNPTTPPTGNQFTETFSNVTVDWGDSNSDTLTVINRTSPQGGPTTAQFQATSHTYADNGDYIVTVTAFDDNGGQLTPQQFTIHVDNVTPALAITGAADVNEGALYTLNLSSSDPGADTITQWTINWGDGVQVVAGNPASVTHTYLDGNANYTISATATDEDGTFAAGNTVDVAVHNVEPTLAITGAADVNEGALYTLNLSSSDPGTDTITQWTINWGDGVQVVSGNPASVTHTYADGDANYVISATATDEDGTFAAGNTVAVAVHNVAPTLTIAGAADVNEGALYTLNLSSSDPGTDSITQWTINWGDSVQVVVGNPSSVTHTYTDGDANYVISATATDEDGTFAAGNTVAVAVHNVAPTLTISGAADVNEGALYTLNLSSSDPGTDTITQWTINWGDSVQVVAGNPSSVTHTYLDGGVNYVISATATDEDGTFAAGNTVAITVHNVDPTLTISGASDVNEGALYTLNLSSSDPGVDTITQWTINWGDSVEVVPGNPSSVTHTYLDGDANYVISATATDEDGTFAAGNTVAVAVHNVAPQITDPADVTIDENQTATLTTTITDPGTPDVFSVDVNWQDGPGTSNTITGLTFASNASGTVGATIYSWDATTHELTVSHQYLDDNPTGTTQDPYNVTLTVHDDDGGTGVTQTTVVTVKNVVPQITDPADITIDENQTATLTTTITDPGTPDVFSVDVNWQDGPGTANTITGLTFTSNASGTVGATNYSWDATTHELTVSHQYLDDNPTGTTQDPYNVTLTVHDDDGGTGATQTTVVTVKNVVPQITDPADITIDENQTATLTTTITDPGTQDVFSVDVNWQDGPGTSNTITGLTFTSNASGTVGATTYSWDATTHELTVSHQYLDDNPTSTTQDPYNVTLTVHDDDGGTGVTQTTVVTVKNVVPQITDPADITIDENQTATLTTTITDPGTQDVFSVDVNWQDGPGTANTITGLTFTSNASGTVGATTYSWDATTHELTVSHQYLDDNPTGTTQDPYNVTLTVHDDDGGTGVTQTTVVTVKNVVPQITDPADITIDENQTATLTTTITDPGTQDVFSVDVNWQDGPGTANTITGLTFTSNASGTVGATTYSWDSTTHELTVSHQYLDDNPTGTTQDPYNVTLTVHDDDGGTGVTQTTVVTVKNVVPQITDPADITIDENQTATLTTTITDPGTPDVFSVDVNWQDGPGTANTITGLTFTSNASGTIGATTYSWDATTHELTVSHQYLDDNPTGTTQDPYNVTLTVHDDDGGTGITQTTVVTVKNVAPQITDPADITIDENQTATLTTTITDPGTQDVFSVDVNWQDGPGTANTITGLTFTSNASGTVGATTYSWDATTHELTVSHQYLDDNPTGTTQDPYNVTLTPHDDDGGTGNTQTTVVTVKNVVPQITDPADITIDENQTATLTTTLTDPGTQDVFSVDVNWQDGPGTANTITGLTFTSNASGTVGATTYSWDATTHELTVSHQYLDDNPTGTTQDPYNVTLTVHDDDGGTGVTQTTVVTVRNVVPQITDPADITIDENQTATLTTTITDPGTQDVFSVDVNWQDGPGTANTITGLTFTSNASGTVGATTYSWDATTHELTVSHQYLDDNPTGTTQDPYNVTLTVHDDDGGTGVTQTTVVTVKNVVPQITDPADITIDENQTATLTTTITDPGTQDVFSVDVNWQDGPGTANTITGLTFTSNASGTVGATTYSWDAATHELTVSHQYLDDNPTGTIQDPYNVTLTVHDDDGGTGVTQTTVVTVKNVTPTVALNLVTDIDENGIATLTGSYTDIGRSDSHSLTVAWGDPNNPTNSTFSITAIRDAAGTATLVTGQTFTSTSGDGAVLTIGTINATTGEVNFSVQHQYLDDGVAPGNGTVADTSTISVTVLDDDTQSGNNTTPVTVHNVAPTIISLTGDSITEGHTATFSFNVSDPGSLDIFTANIDWRDGSTAIISGLGAVDTNGTVGSTVFAWDAATRQLTVTHLYADNSDYAVVVRVADDDMAADFAGVPDPSNFVTQTTLVTVANVPPILGGTTGVTVNEGSAFTLAGLGVHLEDIGFDNPLNQTPPALGDPFKETFAAYTIDWGDGRGPIPVSIDNVGGRVSGSAGVNTLAQFIHSSYTYADDGTYTVTIRVADDNMGAFADATKFVTGTAGVDFVDLTFQIHVNNVAPTLAAPVTSPVVINEAQSVNFTVGFSDPGFDNPLNPNTNPASVLDPKTESFRYFLNWGDGRDQIGTANLVDTNGSVGVPSTGSFAGTHNYADDGTYTVTIRLADDNMGAFNNSALFQTGVAGVDYVEKTFVVTVHNTVLTIVQPLNGDQVSPQGFTTIRLSWNDPGYDNPLNPTTPPVGDPHAESFTYIVNWGDGTTDTILVSNVSGTPQVINAQTSVLASTRVNGAQGVLTTGSFEVQHLYNGPPDPLNPTADITITVTLLDDNQGSVQQTIAISNPGIQTANVAIDTTPDVPKLVFVPAQIPQRVLDSTSAAPLGQQAVEQRVAHNEMITAQERYLELVVLSPDGQIIETHRLSDEALSDMRGFFATLPDNRYQIVLVRGGTRRTVFDVFVRRGRVIDPSDTSEGTRDKPPTSETEQNGGQQNNVVPLNANPLLQPADQNQPNAAIQPAPPVDQPASNDIQSHGIELGPLELEPATVPNRSSLRWAGSLAAVGIAASSESWSRRLGTALEQADENAWQRLRNAGRLGRRPASKIKT